MAELFLYTKIDCPDYGTLEISKVIPFNVLSKFMDIQLDQSKAFRDVVYSVVKKKAFDFSKLTEKDLDFIAQEIAKLYEVESQFLNSRKIGIPRFHSLSSALKVSPKIKGMEESFKRIISPLTKRMKDNLYSYEKLIKPLRLHKDTIKRMRGIQSHMEEFSKGLGAISGFEQAMKSLSIKKEWSEYVAQNSLTIKKMTENLMPTLSLSEGIARSYKSIIKDISFRTNAITNALKPVSSFLDITNEAYKSIGDITKGISSLNKPFKLANSALIDSEKIVVGANNYFSKIHGVQYITPKLKLPRELRDSKEILIKNNEESEEILEFEANTTIFTSNELVSTLITEFQEIKNEISVIKKYKHLWSRMDLLANPPTFLDFLKKFVESLSKDYWDIFWQKKKKKLIARPERLLRSHMGTCIKVGFGDFAYVGRELNIGNGFIDLFVHFLGVEYIVELKMVGPGWPIGWAEGGLNQLDKYMENRGRDKSYLVILDGRKTNRGRQMRDEYDLSHGKVYVISSKIFWE